MSNANGFTVLLTDNIENGMLLENESDENISQDDYDWYWQDDLRNLY